MAIGNIGLTSALSSIAQEQLKQKLQDQQATQEANRLAQAVQFHRDQMAMQEQQKGLDWVQEQARLQNAKDIAYINAQSRENVQGMKGNMQGDKQQQQYIDKALGVRADITKQVQSSMPYKNTAGKVLYDKNTKKPTADGEAYIKDQVNSQMRGIANNYATTNNEYATAISMAGWKDNESVLGATPSGTGKPLTTEANMWYQKQVQAGEPPEALKKHLSDKGYDVSGL